MAGVTSPVVGTPGPPLPPPGLESSPHPLVATRSSRITALVGLGALGAACAYTALVNPNESSAYPQCPLRLVTGYDCALCGGLRATHALLGGDVARAARQNLLVVLLAPFALWALAQWFAAQFGWRLPGPPVRRWMVPVVVVVALTFTVVRNLSWGPGPWLHSNTY